MWYKCPGIRTTVPELRVTLTGLPNWYLMHLWRESFPFADGKGKTLQDCQKRPPGHLEQHPLRNLNPVRPIPCLLAPNRGHPPLNWPEGKTAPWNKSCHEHQHAQQSAEIPSWNAGIGNPMLVNWLDLQLHLVESWSELSSLEVHAYMNWKSWLSSSSDFS